jgi:hypothetical protein
MSERSDGGEKLRRKTIRGVIEDLEFLGSCEGGEIGKACWALEQKLIETAVAEGWNPYYENEIPKDDNETTTQT